MLQPAFLVGSLFIRSMQALQPAEASAIYSGLRFFFDTAPDKPEVFKRVRHAYEPRKIPTVFRL